MQTILGANGTIASVLAKELTAYTNAIRLLSRHPKKVNETDELFAADLTDPAMVEKAVAGSEIVYLLVGLEYKLSVWQQQWPKLMRATIDACIKHKAKVVFFDNVYLYDASAVGHLTEESPINPPSKKGMVRRDVAAMVMDAVQAGQLQALIARSADFYGPNNDKSFLIEVVFKNIKKVKSPCGLPMQTKPTLLPIPLMQPKPLQYSATHPMRITRCGICQPIRNRLPANK
jgi:nucleoside-diphosphate-sugar epimerase